MDTLNLIKNNTYTSSFSGLIIKKTAKILDMSKEILPKKKLENIRTGKCVDVARGKNVYPPRPYGKLDVTTNPDFN